MPYFCLLQSCFNLKMYKSGNAVNNDLCNLIIFFDLMKETRNQTRNSFCNDEKEFVF